jgi:hypothetical protein
MKDFSNRAVVLLNNLSHFNLPEITIEPTRHNWQYQIESSDNNEILFKILTLKYYLKMSSDNQIELLILEVFSTLVESRSLNQVFNLSFKEVESYLRDINTRPSIPSVFLDKIIFLFEATKTDFLVFLLFNEYLENGSNLKKIKNWGSFTLSEKAHFIDDALIFSKKYYGKFMPSRLVSITSSEVVMTHPLRPHPLSEVVFRLFLDLVGVTANLKLVAV